MDPTPHSGKGQLLKRAFRVFSFTSGIMLTGYFLRNREWASAAWAFLLSAAAVLWNVVSSFVMRFLAELDRILIEDMAPRLARSFANAAEGGVKKYWWLATARFKRKYNKSLESRYSEFRTLGLTVGGKFALDFQDIFVPLKVVPESLNRISSALIRPESDKSAKVGVNIWDFLAVAGREPACKRIAVIGAPGSGKTTLLEHIALTYARGNERRQNPKAPRLIPAVIYLREVKDMICADESARLSDVVEAQRHVKDLDPRFNWFETKLRNGRCVAMLDGLDEVADPAERKKVGQWVTRQMELYRDSQFILTSRQFGYKEVPVERIGVILEVLPLSTALTSRFLHNWYLQHEMKQRLLQDGAKRRSRKEDKALRTAAEAKALHLLLLIKQNPTLRAMSPNPLLLTMIATVHDNKGALPTNREKLFEEICVVLLGKREEDKKLDVAIPAEQKQFVLQVLALETMQRRKRGFSFGEGRDIIAERLAQIETGGRTPDEFFEHVEKVSGLLRLEGNYEFAHKNLQEYLAAVEIKESGRERILIENVGEQWWEETIRLYALMHDATAIISAALDKNTVATFRLAIECVNERAKMADEVRWRLNALLKRGIESPESKHFRLAAETMLDKRLSGLTIGEHRSRPDDTCITCAEFQLFLEEGGPEAAEHRPAHWGGRPFPRGTAAHPVTGVSYQAAKAFCQWLSERAQGRDYQYRLPTSGEMFSAVRDEGVRCWCEVEHISGKEDTSVEQFRRLLEAELYSDLTDQTPPDLPDGFISPEAILGHAYWGGSLSNARNLKAELARQLWRVMYTVADSTDDPPAVPAGVTQQPADNVVSTNTYADGRWKLLASVAAAAMECHRRLGAERPLETIFSLAVDLPEDSAERDAALSYVRYSALHEMLFWYRDPGNDDLSKRFPEVAANLLKANGYLSYRSFTPFGCALALYSFAVHAQRGTEESGDSSISFRIVKERVRHEEDWG